MSTVDYKRQKQNKTEAMNRAKRIAREHPDRINFTNHAEEQMQKRGLTTQDVLNVLTSPSTRIADEPDFEKGSFRYRMMTKLLCVVISFTPDGVQIWVITAFRN